MEARICGEMARQRLITSRESRARCISSVSSPRLEEGGEGGCWGKGDVTVIHQ